MPDEINWYVLRLETGNYIAIKTDERPDPANKLIRLIGGRILAIASLNNNSPCWDVAYGPCTETEADTFLHDMQ